MSPKTTSPTEGLAQWGSPEFALTSNENNGATVAQPAEVDKSPLEALREQLRASGDKWLELEQQRAAVAAQLESIVEHMDQLAAFRIYLLEKQRDMLGHGRIVALATQALIDIGPFSPPKDGGR